MPQSQIVLSLNELPDPTPSCPLLFNSSQHFLFWKTFFLGGGGGAPNLGYQLLTPLFAIENMMEKVYSGTSL